MSQEENSEKKSSAKSLAEMLEAFGSAVSEIFNDPKLKDKARQFGDGVAQSAETFADRFKDEDVKEKFRDVGRAAQDFGKSVSDCFKVDKEEEKDSKPPTEPSSSNTADVGKRTGLAADDYFTNTKVGRITSSSFTITWSVVLLVFFTLFNQYIAYYQLATVDTVSSWIRYPILTGDFNAWLPILTVTLSLSILGHVVLIIFDKYLLRETVVIVLTLFGIATVVTLLSIFPFDFSVIPNPNIAEVLSIVITIALIGITIGLGIATLVRFIKLIVNVLMKKTGY
jgi:hypothetical protein